MASKLAYPHPTDSRVTTRMRANRRTDTKPELAVRSEIHALGLRFRKDYAVRLRDRVVRPDIVFTRPKVAVFIDGCFWHRCPVHGNTPTANSEYWGPKLKRNVERDRCVDERLTEAGWQVLRAWEHEGADDVAERIAEAVAVARLVSRSGH